MILSEIIERLEAATGADRRLDAEIAVYLGWQRPDAKRPYAWTKPIGPDGSVTTCNDSFIPRYTASVDAALTLVPEGLNWLLGKGRTRPDEPLYGAQVLDGAAVAGEGETDATPAIAICIASLRARSAP